MEKWCMQHEPSCAQNVGHACSEHRSDLTRRPVAGRVDPCMMVIDTNDYNLQVICHRHLDTVHKRDAGIYSVNQGQES